MRFAGLTLVWLLSAALIVAACGSNGDSPVSSEKIDWGYQGSIGPENWASLSDEYSACSQGRQQSPVDITAYEEGDAGTISLSYGGNAKAVRNDGKFVQVNYPPGNTLSVGGQSFQLKSAHFHSPSEHLMDGQSFAAELHLVHAHAEGHLLVMGLLFRRGDPSPVVQAVLEAAPAPGNVVSGGAMLDAGDYLPSSLAYYRYDGSKTTPPCDEPVIWYVMREPKTISQKQVEDLQALGGGPNNRPVQPIGSRVIIAGGGR